ncbi:MAG: pentapeptide repeat-containing protein [Burkholderiales bacterium]|nr:pentapeptide repeat-containing protein [Burkholderiales bacterium]
MNLLGVIARQPAGNLNSLLGTVSDSRQGGGGSINQGGARSTTADSGVRQLPLWLKIPLDRGEMFSVRYSGPALKGRAINGLTNYMYSFTKADISGTSFNGNFAYASFSKLKQVEAPSRFIGNFIGAKFSDMDVYDDTTFRGDFSGASFSRFWALNARFGTSNLTGAKFENSILIGSDLSDANLSGVKFRNVQIDKDTRFPKNFNVDALLRDGSLTYSQNGHQNIIVD